MSTPYVGRHRKPEDDETDQPSRRTQWLRTIGVILGMWIAWCVLVNCVIQPFVVPSASMENTLNPGDRILVNHLDTTPRRGEVIVFSDPSDWMGNEHPSTFQKIAAAIQFQSNKEHLVKRIIGLPGDTVHCASATSPLTINGHEVEETYVKDGTSCTFGFTAKVPAGHVWVMGDHRDDSYDSRFNGPVPIKDITGTVAMKVWPW